MSAKNTPTMEEQFRLFQAFLASQDTAQESPKGTSRGATRKASAKPKKLVGITHEQAWEALGADPSMPHYADKPATNRQLWVLNTRGKLSLS